MGHYQFICRCLMTHEIKEYLCTVAAVAVCLESGCRSDGRPFGSQKCREAQLDVDVMKRLFRCGRCLSTSKMYLSMRFLESLRVRVCVRVRLCGWIGIRMYRRTSNMAGLTYPPTALTALKVRTVLYSPIC